MSDTSTSSKRGTLAELRPQRLFILLLVVSFGIIVLRFAALAFFSVPSESMLPTLEPGDYVVVNKLGTQVRRLIRLVRDNTGSMQLDGQGFERNSVVAFWRSNDDNPKQQTVYVKRIAACAGDTFALRSDSVYIGNSALAIRTDSSFMPKLVSQQQRVPFRGQKIELSAQNLPDWRALIASEGNDVRVENNIVYINGNASPAYVLQHDYFLMLGDNRRNSFDSRYFGYVSDDAIIGTASMIYWSVGGVDSTAIKWSRMARCIH